MENYEYWRYRTFRSLLLMFAAIFLNKGTLYAIVEVLIDHKALPGAEAFGIGVVMAAYLGIVTVSTLLFGYYSEKLSEKYSRKKILVFTQMGWVICYGLVPFVTHFYQYLALNAIAAFFVGAFIPLALTMVGEFYPPEERGKRYGWMNLGLILGLGGGMLFGRLFASIEVIGWRLAYGLGAALGLAAIIGYYIVGIEPQRGREEPEFKDMKEIRYDYKITWTKLKELFKNKTIAALMISLLIQGFAVETIGVWTIYYFEVSKGLGSFAVIFYLIAGIGAMPGNIIGGHLGDKYYNEGNLKGRVIISLVGLVVGIGALFGFYFIPLFSGSGILLALSYILILGSGFVGYLFSGFPPGNQFAIYSEVCVPEVRSTANAMHSTMVNLGGVPGNLLLTGLLAVEIAFLPMGIAILLVIQLIGALLWIIPYFTYPKEAQDCRNLMAGRREEITTKIDS